MQQTTFEHVTELLKTGVFTGVKYLSLIQHKYKNDGSD